MRTFHSMKDEQFLRKLFAFIFQFVAFAIRALCFSFLSLAFSLISSKKSSFSFHHSSFRTLAYFPRQSNGCPTFIRIIALPLHVSLNGFLVLEFMGSFYRTKKTLGNSLSHLALALLIHFFSPLSMTLFASSTWLLL